MLKVPLNLSSTHIIPHFVSLLYITVTLPIHEVRLHHTWGDLLYLGITSVLAISHSDRHTGNVIWD